MKNKAIIFDVDGTAIDSPKQKIPSKRLIKAIEKLKYKYYLCAATGRVWSFAKSVLQNLHLTDPSIISAGTQICDPVSGEILWQQNINKDSLNKVINVFKSYPEYKLLYNDATEDDYFNGGISPKDFKTQEEIYFLEQIFVPDKVAIEIYEKIKGINDLVCVMVIAQKPGTRDLHIIDSSATKEHTIARLLKQIGVDKQNTIGIGDSYNDVHLFNAVHYKVAVGNAITELKDKADKVIDSVSEDGMAKFLETL